MYLRCLLTAASVLPGMLTSQIIPVSGGGTALATAVAQAPDGAVLVVSPGTYDTISFVLNKDVTIVAPQRATITGSIDARQGSPQNTLRLVGLDVQPIWVPWPPWQTFGDIGSIGNLHVADCTCAQLTVVNASSRRRVFIANTTAAGTWSHQLSNVDAIVVDSSFQAGVDGKLSHSGLFVIGTLRAERIVVHSGTGSTPATGLVIDGTATIVDSTLVGHAGLPMYGPPGFSIANAVANELTLWTSVVPNGVALPYVTRMLATAEWTQRNWRVGSTSSVLFTEGPNRLVAVVASWGLEPWTSPLAAEPLFVGPNTYWFVATIGVTNGSGVLPSTFPIPNIAAVRYRDAWLTGLFFDPLPARTTASIGGMIL